MSVLCQNTLRCLTGVGQCMFLVVMLIFNEVSVRLSCLDVAVLRRCLYLLISVIWENLLEICLKKSSVRLRAPPLNSL